MVARGNLLTKNRFDHKREGSMICWRVRVAAVQKTWRVSSIDREAQVSQRERGNWANKQEVGEDFWRNETKEIKASASKAAAEEKLKEAEEAKQKKSRHQQERLLLRRNWKKLRKPSRKRSRHQQTRLLLLRRSWKKLRKHPSMLKTMEDAGGAERCRSWKMLELQGAGTAERSRWRLWLKRNCEGARRADSE